MFSERAEFLQRAKWGIFMHFLARELYAPMDSVRWNAEVEAFDAEKLASQLAEIGAGYFFLTLGQNSGWFCSPNRTLDRLTNREGNGRSRCSRRDLVEDMAAELQPYRIPLLVYLPCHGPAGDTEAMIALDGIPPWDYQLWSPREREVLDRHRSSDPRLRKFLRNWEAVIREWSERWGTSVCGWWFDGCYFKERLYDFPDEPNFASLAAAVRAGNPRSVFAANPGVFRDPVAISAEEDYTSGENTRPDLSCCRTPSVDGALYHILTFAGNNWCALPLRYGADEVAQITGNIVAGGGVVSWDVPYNRSDGTLPAEVMKCFRSLRTRLDGERPEEARRREIAWLNLNWFMTTLLDRKDRMSMYSGLEVRVLTGQEEAIFDYFGALRTLETADGLRVRSNITVYSLPPFLLNNADQSWAASSHRPTEAYAAASFQREFELL